MKILHFEKELCIGCHSCEEACATLYFKTPDITKARLKIVERVDDFNEAILCNQCGECIDVCPEDALYKAKNGITRMHKDICVGCLMCVGYCKSFMYHDEMVEPFKCVSCGHCTRNCPTGALTMVEVEVA